MPGSTDLGTWSRNRRTGWQTWDNDRHEVLCIAYNPSAIFDEMWLWTTGPLIGISVIFAEFSKGENGKRIFEELKYREQIPLFDINRCFLIWLHFSTGCYIHSRVSGNVHCFHFCRIQILSAWHFHWCSGIFCTFSFLWLNCRRCKKTPNFSRQEEGRFVLYFELQDTFAYTDASLLFFPSLPENGPQILERTGCAREDKLVELHQAVDHFFPEFSWNVVRFLNNRTLRVGLRIFVHFRRIDADFGSSVFWKTQPKCREFFNKATATSLQFLFGFLMGWPSTCWCIKTHLLPNLQPDDLLIVLTSERMPWITRGARALTSEVFTARLLALFPRWTCFRRGILYHRFLCSIPRKDWIWVSIFHAYCNGDGTCHCLLLNTVLSLSTESMWLFAAAPVSILTFLAW